MASIHLCYLKLSCKRLKGERALELIRMINANNYVHENSYLIIINYDEFIC